MPKIPLSVTLEENNLLWLKGRVATTKRRSLSEALDELITSARTGGHGAAAARSVVGTVDIAPDDPTLAGADSYVQSMFAASLQRPFLERETATASATPRRPRKKTRG